MTLPLLKKLETVQALPDPDRQLLQEMLVDVRSFGAKRDIIREGERPDYVHVMVEGWSCRYQVLPDGKRQITAFLLPGDVCDPHVTVLGKMDHTIGALTPCSVAFVSRELMLSLFDRPAIARALWWASLVDEGVMRAWIVNLGQRDALERVAHLICELHARLENVGLVDGDDFELPMTQEELADALGLTPVHVNRVLRQLRESGLMTLQKKQIVILNMTKLRHMADFDPGYLHLVAR